MAFIDICSECCEGRHDRCENYALGAITRVCDCRHGVQESNLERSVRDYACSEQTAA